MLWTETEAQNSCNGPIKSIPFPKFCNLKCVNEQTGAHDYVPLCSFLYCVAIRHNCDDSSIQSEC